MFFHSVQQPNRDIDWLRKYMRKEDDTKKWIEISQKLSQTSFVWFSKNEQMLSENNSAK